MTKIVKTDSTIAPVSDFAQKIDEALRKSQEKPAERVVGECWAAFKYENGTISRCKCPPGHGGDHANGSNWWNTQCDSTAQGERCRYQLNHEGSHIDVRKELTWTNEIPGLASIADMLKSSPSFQKALANKIAASRPIVRQVPLTKSRAYMLGFGPVAVPPERSSTISVAPGCYFRGDRLMNEGESEGLYLEQIFIGNRIQMPVSVGGTWVGFYNNNQPDTVSTFDTCQPAFAITLVVRNVSTVERKFAMSMYGKAVV